MNLNDPDEARSGSRPTRRQQWRKLRSSAACGFIAAAAQKRKAELALKLRVSELCTLE